jgi:DNA-binding response OmpR family regulator/outer membrane protein OmpA-like peptidoglycan-associated protein
LLIAENDASLAGFLNDEFAAEHYTVDVAHDSNTARSMVQENDCDLAILDLNLPQADGMEILQYFRSKRPQLPILILTCRNRPEERVQALDLGADDLVLKPFSFVELSARVRALLRRGGRSQQAILRMDDLEVNRVEHSVRRASRTIELTPKEFGLLEYLMRNEGQRVTRSQIIEHVWNLSFDTLLAFFVVMFASQMEKKRVSQLAAAIQVAFQQMGIFDSSNSQPALATTEPMPFAAAQVVENVDRIQNMGRIVNSPRQQVSESPERSNLDKVQRDLQTGLSRQIERHTVSVTRTKEGIVVSLKEAGFFDSGSIALRPEALPTLTDIVKVIGPGRMRIRIEGHTDNVRIHSVRYDSNWELSTARATEIIKLLIIRYSITPNRLFASGYGEYFPVASNLNPEGRSQNRRVDLVILNSEPSFLPPPPSVVPARKQKRPRQTRLFVLSGRRFKVTR